MLAINLNKLKARTIFIKIIKIISEMESNALATSLSDMGFDSGMIQRVLPLCTTLEDALNLILTFQEEEKQPH